MAPYMYMYLLPLSGFSTDDNVSVKTRHYSGSLHFDATETESTIEADMLLMLCSLRIIPQKGLGLRRTS